MIEIEEQRGGGRSIGRDTPRELSRILWAAAARLRDGKRHRAQPRLYCCIWEKGGENQDATESSSSPLTRRHLC